MKKPEFPKGEFILEKDEYKYGNTMKETLFFNNIRETWSVLRKLRIFNRFWWSNLWYIVRCYFNPRNKWANKVIPNTYSDKVELIPNFLFAAIINFVDKKDGEDCFGRIDWYNSSKEHRKVAVKIKEIYKWAKYDRNKVLKKLDKSYPKIPKNVDILEWINRPDKEPYEITYKNVIKYEKILKDGDDKYLEMIVKIRDYLWT